MVIMRFALLHSIPMAMNQEPYTPIFQDEMDTLSMKGLLLAMHDFPNHLQNILLIKWL